MATTKELIQASEDIVWGSEKNVYSAARDLMYAAMSHSVLPIKVNSTRKWATEQAAVHNERAKAFREIIARMTCAEDTSGVWRLVEHHQHIAARYRMVAVAMQD